MNSLQDLNNFSLTEFEITDDRTANVIFDRPAAINQTDSVYENQTISAKTGIEIAEVINYASSAPTYTINVSSLVGATVSWPTVPAGCTVSNPSTGVYRISGVNSRSIWLQIRNPVITMPYGYSGLFTYTSTITYNTSITKSWTVATTVINVEVFLNPTTFDYTPSIAQTLLGTPIFQSEGPITGVTWTLTITPSTTIAVNTLSSSGTGGSSSFNNTSKVLTITGLKAEVVSHLANITFTASDYIENFNFTYYISSGGTAQTDSKIQTITCTTTALLTHPIVDYYYSDTPSEIINYCPQITDATHDGTGTYTMTIQASPNNAVSYINANGATGGGTSSETSYIIGANDGVAGDQFGYSTTVNFDNTYIVSGSPTADYSTYTNAGAVYVYTKSGTTVTQQAKLIPNDPENSQNFGQQVAIDRTGETIAVGAPNTTYGSVQLGAVYIFTRTGTTWTQQAKLIPSDAAGYSSGSGFGSKLSFSSVGNILAISGLFGVTSGTNAQGGVYIFNKVLGAWTQTAKILAGDIVDFDRFGFNVSINYAGDTVAIYAQTGAATTLVGAVYIYKFNGTSWVQNQKIVPGTGFVFGSGLSQSGNGNYLSILTFNTSYTTEYVRVYLLSGGTFSQQQQISQTATQITLGGTTFGSYLNFDYNGNTLAISDYFSILYGPSSLWGTTTPPTTGAVRPLGTVFVYTRSGTTWSDQGWVWNGGLSEVGQYLGQSLQLTQDGTELIAGALVQYNSSDVNIGLGHVQLFTNLKRRTYSSATNAMTITGTRDQVNNLLKRFSVQTTAGRTADYKIVYSLSTPYSQFAAIRQDIIRTT